MIHENSPLDWHAQSAAAGNFGSKEEVGVGGGCGCSLVATRLDGRRRHRRVCARGSPSRVT